MLFGGTAPISTSRITPPPSAVANDSTSNPSRSSSARIAVIAPSTAKTNVPTRSTASSTTSWLYFGNHFASDARTIAPLPSPPLHFRSDHRHVLQAHVPSRL